MSIIENSFIKQFFIVLVNLVGAIDTHLSRLFNRLLEQFPNRFKTGSKIILTKCFLKKVLIPPRENSFLSRKGIHIFIFVKHFPDIFC